MTFKTLQGARFLAGAITIVSAGRAVSAQTVFTSNFDGAIPAEISGPGTAVVVQGWAGLGPAGNQFGGSMLRNQATGIPQPATRLSLAGLPAHNYVKVAFLLAIIDSWDGFGNAQGPDSFNVSVDGSNVFSQVFACAAGTSPYVPAPGVLLSQGTQLGFLNGQYYDHDQALNMGMEPVLAAIPHTASTLTIDFFASGPGWQGADDESWAIDNLNVSVFTCFPPTVELQPVSNSACPTGAAAFSTQGVGTGPFTYQWQIQTAPGVWQFLGNDPGPLPCGGGAFAYAAPLNSPQVQIGVRACPGVNSYKIRCIVSNACGSTPSQEVTYSICYANCDCSTSSPRLTANDFQCFLNKFAAANSEANCDGSTSNPTLTANDFQCFLNAYAAGCS